jgi:class 3 adenylate cyclase
MDAPSIQYAQTSDGVSIAYTVTGDGPVLVALPHTLSHIQLDRAIPEAAGWYERIGRGRTLVRFDSRGLGMSQGQVDLTVDARDRDIDAVLERLRGERVALLALMGTVPTAVGYAARRPERVSALVLVNGSSDFDPGRLPVVSATYTLSEGDRKLFLDMTARTTLGSSNAELVDRFVTRLREHGYVEWFEEYMRARREGRVTLDVCDQLPAVTCPTLVLHRRDFPNLPVGEARDLAARIPGARLEVLDGDAGLPWAGDGQAAVDAIEAFLAGVEGRENHAQAAAAPGGFQTILFTDLESSTAITQRLGDEGAQELLRGHNEAVRAALEEHGGREVKHTGDGIMASFPSAVAAVMAGLQMQRDLAGGEVRVRVGINAGEPIAEDDDLFGLSVIKAARIGDRAEPGQVLVSDVVRQLCEGKTFEFTSVGDATLKGFDEPVALYEVSA